MRVADKLVLITGGASGLGYAAAQVMLAAGARVALFDRDAERVAQAAQTLGANASAYAVDVIDAAAVATAIDRLGPLHALLNCAGIGPASRTLGRQGPMPLELFERVLQINLVGSFNVARLAAAVMARNEPDAEGERGVIVHTASVAAFEGQIGQVAYAASKGGIVAMTLPMARDLAGLGIRVNAIAPGIFDTPLMQAASEEVRQPLIAATQFPKRLGEPQEFGRLALHILENRFLNASVLRLDGGLRMPPR